MQPDVFYSPAEHEPFAIGDGDHGVLLIHGFPGTPAELRPLAERLAAAGFATRAIQLPGMGRDIINLNTATQAAWLEAVRAAWAETRRRYEHASIIGYSVGGALALHLTVEHPPDRLVLVAPFWKWLFPLGALLPLLKRVFREVEPFRNVSFDEPLLRDYLDAVAPGVDFDDPDVQRELRARMKLSTNVLDEVRTLGLSGYRLARRVWTPTLVLQGRSDITVSPAATRQLLARFLGPVRYAEYGAGHDMIWLREYAAAPLDAPIARFLRAADDELGSPLRSRRNGARSTASS